MILGMESRVSNFLFSQDFSRQISSMIAFFDNDPPIDKNILNSLWILMRVRPSSFINNFIWVKDDDISKISAL